MVVAVAELRLQRFLRGFAGRRKDRVVFLFEQQAILKPEQAVEQLGLFGGEASGVVVGPVDPFLVAAEEAAVKVLFGCDTEILDVD